MKINQENWGIMIPFLNLTEDEQIKLLFALQDFSHKQLPSSKDLFVSFIPKQHVIKKGV